MGKVKRQKEPFHFMENSFMLFNLGDQTFTMTCQDGSSSHTGLGIRISLKVNLTESLNPLNTVKDGKHISNKICCFLLAKGEQTRLVCSTTRRDGRYPWTRCLNSRTRAGKWVKGFEFCTRLYVFIQENRF